MFREFKSKIMVCGVPLIHITSGICPETGRRIWARGVIAVGRKAVGVLAIGQLSIGIIAIGQLSIALTFAIAQLSIAGFFSVGQLAAGFVAIGQLSTGYYVLGQLAWGKYVFSTTSRDFEAVTFFRGLWEKISSIKSFK